MHVRITIQSLVYLTYRMIPKYLAHIGDGRHTISKARILHNTFNQSHVLDTEDVVVGQKIFDALMIRL